MKALTIHQPWASLIACGAKVIETRSWTTKYRGPLAIHAAKKVIPLNIAFSCQSLKWRREVNDKICLSYSDYKNIPVGGIVAICNLVNCIEIPHTGINGLEISITPREEIFGNYTPGRFAWILEDIKPLVNPVPAKGLQRLWEWKVPEGVRL